MTRGRSTTGTSRVIAALSTMALAGGLVALTAAPAQAAALTVDSTAGSGTPGDGACTLREAITNANADADLSSGDCVAGSGADTITFQSGLTGTILLGSQLPTVTDGAGLSITGPGASSLTVSGGSAVRLLRVATGASLEVSGLTLASGLTGSLTDGGGALLNEGTTTLTEVVATSNVAVNVSGGAVDNRGTLTIAASTFTDNGTTASGGAVASRSFSTLTVSESSFSGNSATVGGGAIDNLGLTTVIASTFTGNASATGGAVRTGDPSTTMTISRSTFGANFATISGGAVRTDGFLLIDRSTFAGNTTDGAGGAIAAGPVLELLEIDHSTFAANAGAPGGATLDTSMLPMYVRGSIVSAPSGQAGCNSVVIDLGANIDSDGSCSFGGPGSDVDPLLGPLADNGGPTETIMPLPGSPALDAIDPGTLRCPGASPALADLATDQRGIARPQGPKCDIGAVEVVPVAPPVVYTVSPFAKPVSATGVTKLKAGDTLPLKFSVTDGDGARVLDLAGSSVGVSVRLGSCGSNVVDVNLDLTAGSGLLLRADGTYQYDLKTQKSWAGLCGTVTVTTPNDGARTADLQFTGGGRGRG